MLLINQCVGDALSDMLYCMGALNVLHMTLLQWSDLYRDLPSRQQKVAVLNKHMVRCSEDETRILEPAVMQADLDDAMKSISNGRLVLCICNYLFERVLII